MDDHYYFAGAMGTGIRVCRGVCGQFDPYSARDCFDCAGSSVDHRAQSGLTGPKALLAGTLLMREAAAYSGGRFAF